MTHAILDVDDLEMALMLVDEMGRIGVCVEIDFATGSHAVDGVAFTDFDEVVEHCRGVLCRRTTRH